MKVLIVGGGIAGLALASFLEKAGFDYRIIEREKDWSKHGFSLGLWSNGRNMLSKLGLREQFDENMIPFRKFVVKNFSDKIIKTQSLEEFHTDYGLAYSHVRRQDLHDWLLTGVDPKKIKMGTTISQLSTSDSGVQATFSDGTADAFDLLIGADGVHSAIRKICFSNNLEYFFNWRCWYVSPKKHLSTPQVLTEYIEPGKLLNVFDDRTTTLAIFGIAVDHNTFDEPLGRIDRLREQFKSLPYAQQLLEGLSDNEVLPTDLEEIHLNTWIKDRIVLVGDAAHGFEPFGGMGGSMALEDAYVLAGQLMQVSKSYPLNQALLDYENKRRERVALARHATHKMKSWDTIRSPLLFKLVTLLAPLIPGKYFSKDFVTLMNEEL